MKQLSSHIFKDVYRDIGINLDNLGCVMLDLSPIKNEWISDDDLYFTDDEKKFWIDGWVAGKHPHITLLYGLLENAHNYERQISSVLDGWKMPIAEVETVSFFDSPYENEPYYCVVAHIKPTPELIEGHQRLEFLPHINTFTGYKPHFTLAYIKKDVSLMKKTVALLQENISGKSLLVGENVNLGKPPTKEPDSDIQLQAHGQQVVR